MPLVMIVEDEVLIALGLEDILRDEGYDVTGPFSSCADALAQLTAEVPDAAIVDAVLKDGVCLELARELRRRRVPFIVYSGRDEFEEHPPELDGVPWFEKPGNLDTVMQAIAEFVGR